jgi:GNAT superfamily N-acetyltransferase
MERIFGPYTISDDPTKVDLQFAHRELSQSYWSKNIPFTVVEKAAANSLCFCVHEGPVQVAYARVITDRATFAYLCDVIVTESHRGNGIGKAMMEFIMAHPDLQGLRRFTLGTKDAHGLYEQFGFAAPRFPDRLMEINRPGLYEKGE